VLPPPGSQASGSPGPRTVSIIPAELLATTQSPRFPGTADAQSTDLPSGDQTHQL
jgi:hypothetical protein